MAVRWGGRREFLGRMLLAGAGLSLPSAFAARQEDGMRAFLLQLGHNQWCDCLPEDMNNAILRQGAPAGKGCPDTLLRNRDDLWGKATARLRSASAAAGAWARRRMRSMIP